MSKGVILKQEFYDQLKPFAANKHLPILFFYKFGGDQKHYCLVFDWTSRKPNGDFNPIMSAQLYDDRLGNSVKKYITDDLIWDCQKEGTTTNYKLWKYLNAWATTAIEKYEKGADQNG